MDAERHGTLNWYSYHKCRCDLCRAAKKASHRSYYLAHRDEVLRLNRERVALDPAKKREQDRAYRLANLSAVREKNRDYERTHPAEANERSKRWRQRHPDWARAVVRKSRTGVDRQTYETFTLIQGGLCGICGEPMGEFPNADHDHQTGRARGLLCQLCNRGLGHFRDSPVLLRSAIRWLDI